MSYLALKFPPNINLLLMNPNSRRDFVKKIITAGAVLTFFNPLQLLFANKSKPVLPSWTELVDWARWCPTVHNLQPHKIRVISETEAELLYDPKRLLPVGDPDSIFVTVAMGI